MKECFKPKDPEAFARLILRAIKERHEKNRRDAKLHAELCHWADVLESQRTKSGS